MGCKGEVHCIIGHEASGESKAAVPNLGFTDPRPWRDYGGRGWVHKFGWIKNYNFIFTNY
jgi:hypothetical protein